MTLQRTEPDARRMDQTGPLGIAAAPPKPLRAMAAAILAQCAGGLGSQVFRNGLLLLYLKSLGLSDTGIIVALSLPDAAMALAIPEAYLADRQGIKRVGYSGLALAVLGFLLVSIAGSARTGAAAALAAAGIAVYAIGNSAFTSGWFALISGIVPAGLRGRFFGALRSSWQSVVMAFTFACSALLPADAPRWTLQLALGAVTLGQAIRLLLYARIPENVPRDAAASRGLLAALWRAARVPRYLGFCTYALLLSLFTVGTPILFGLVESQFLRIRDNDFILLGSATMAGFLAGFAAGGWMVDAIRLRNVLVACHLVLALVMGLFPLRDQLPIGLIPLFIILHLLYGLAWSASNVAISAKMLAMTPSRERSMVTALCLTFLSAGNALSANVAAALLGLGLVPRTWSLLGRQVHGFDAILLLYALGTVLLLIPLAMQPPATANPIEGEAAGL